LSAAGRGHERNLAAGRRPPRQILLKAMKTFLKPSNDFIELYFVTHYSQNQFLHHNVERAFGLKLTQSITALGEQQVGEDNRCPLIPISKSVVS
jgi:hypothetical protein